MNADKENPLAVSEYLIKCFQSVFDKPKKENVQTVITMIAKNLTFDDPGMFMKSLVSDERDRLVQDATAIWLINQVIWMSNEPQFYWYDASA